MHRLNNENQRPGGDPKKFAFLFGTQSGGRTLNQGEGGGSPFASALIELLARKKLTIDTLARDIAELTERSSRAFQRVEVSPISSEN
jgi:hypothetical protein